MKDKITAHRVRIAPMALCLIGLTAWAFPGCSSPAGPASNWTVSFDGNGSDGGEVPTANKYAQGATVVLPDAGTLTKTDHIFNGWNDNKDGSGTLYPAGAPWTMETSPVTFHAQWIRVYPISFDGNGSDGGEVPTAKKYAQGATVVLPDAGTLTKTDLLFNGWKSTKDESGTLYQAGESWTMGTSPVTFHAQWVKGYAITFDGNGSDGGEVPAAKKYAQGATVVLPDAGTLTKTDHIFNGWKSTKDESGTLYRAGESWTMGTAPVTFHAQWVKGYAITFDGNGSDGGEVPTAKKYAQGAKVTLPDAGTLTKTDHIFNGWKSTKEGSGTLYRAGESWTMGTSPVTFHAQWVRVYAITFDGNGSDGGEVPAVKKYAQGVWEKLPDAGTMTKTDHIFNGWNDNANGEGNPYNSGANYIMGNSPLTLYAQWKKRS